MKLSYVLVYKINIPQNCDYIDHRKRFYSEATKISINSTVKQTPDTKIKLDRKGFRSIRKLIKFSLTQT